MSVAGSSVQLSTFNKWNVEEAGIGYKKIVKDGVVMVNFVWCKLCAKHIAAIRNQCRVRGIANQEVGKYATGTSIVTKHNVTRHLGGIAHQVAIDSEKSLGAGQCESVTSAKSSTSGWSGGTPGTRGIQSKINGVVNKQAKDTYRKLLRTAYSMAVDGVTLASFKTLVKCQRANGVKLLEGAENDHAVRELTHEIANAIREKVAVLLCSCTAFSVLSDGSRALKTGSEKELVMIRTVKCGIPLYYVLGLRDIDQFEDSDVEHLKKSIDQLFEEKCQMPKERYINVMVSASAIGASVNSGIYNGVLTIMKNDGRNWLLTIHSVSHRLEAAVKDVILQHKEFSDVKNFLVSLYFLMKRSSKVKKQFEKIATTLFEIQIYHFPKVHGAQFVEPQRNGLAALLNNWVPLGLAIEDMITKKKNQVLAPKLKGILQKLKDYQFLANCCLYKSILDEISDLSIKLDTGELMVFDVTPACDVTIGNLMELSSASECQVHEYGFTLDEVSHNMTIKLPKLGNVRSKLGSSELVDLPLEMEFVELQLKMTCPEQEEAGDDDRIGNLKSKVIPEVQKCLIEGLMSFRNDLYRHMIWVDPANWKQKIEDEMPSLEYIAQYFQNTLNTSGFKREGLAREWRNFKLIVNNYYAGISVKELWPKIFQYRRAQFPNVCMLVEVVMAIGPSNNVVAKSCSHLRAMLSDEWLALHHSTMEDLILIRGNDSSWTDEEREEIIDVALNRYILKKRKLAADQHNFGTIGNGSKTKKMKFECEEDTHGAVPELQEDSDHSCTSDSDSDWSSLASDECVSFIELSDYESLAEGAQLKRESTEVADQDTM